MTAMIHGYLVLKNIPDREWSYPINERRQTIGRAPDCQVRVPNHFDSVSRRHAEVWSDRKGMWIRDCHSRAGTNINGVWVDHVPQARLIVGDTLGLGPASLEVVPDVAGLAAAPALPGVASPTYCGGDQDTSLFHQVVIARVLAHTLSPAEIDVLLWLGRGIQGDIEVGQLLHRSPNTVRTQVASIYKKLGLHSRAELLAWVRRANHSPGSPAPPAGRRGPRSHLVRSAGALARRSNAAGVP
ncbi:MAG: FHA domain-containing protein [Gemmataceae bacterium]|nr:FHA domain-containing protein [Gemmataceae bacterium]